MTRRQCSASLEKKVYLIIFQALLFLLIAANSVFGATASISVPGSEGRFTVSVSGPFPTYVTCNSANPPVCTSCNSGSIALYLNGRYQGGASGDGSASWSNEYDTGIMAQGSHIFSARASDCGGNTDRAEKTIIVDNTPELNIGNIGEPNGFMNIAGSVKFKKYDGGGSDAVNDGTISLYLDGRYRGGKSYEGSAGWSFEEIVGYKLDAGILPNGEHTLKAIARAANGAQTIKEVIFTVDNTPEPTILGMKSYGDNTNDILGTTVFKENATGNEGTVTLYIKEVGAASYTSCGSRSFEGKNVSWKYSDFTGARLQKSVWGQKEIIAKVVATAANGASATVEKKMMIPALGPCSTKF